jgi:hypothetical protein
MGCRKAVDTGNYFVEGGAWHDDRGRRLIILVNHDLENPQAAELNGQTVKLQPGDAVTRVVTP